MSAAAAATGDEAAAAGDAPKRSRKKLLILAGAPLLLVALGGGLWASGLLGGLLGGGGHGEDSAHAEAQGHDAHGGHGGAAAPAPAARGAPVFVDMPDIIANLNSGSRRTSFVKLRSKLELARPEDAAAVQAAMPRLQDLFTTYLREIRPEELRGSAGTYRLREELLARANIAVAPAKVTDVLFLEILQQ